MMAFVKRDKSKATVVFRRKRQKVQLQNTEGKGNSHCMIKRKFLEINFHKTPFPPPFRRGHCPADEKIINQQDLNIFKGKDGSLMHLHQ